MDMINHNAIVQELLSRDYMIELTLILESDKIGKFSYNKASLLQGVLMEHISSEYADRMHKEGLRPYSQSVRFVDGKNMWQIRTLNKEAFRNIVLPLLNEEFDSFYIRHNQAKVKIVEKNLRFEGTDEIIEDFYEGYDSDRFVIEFRTPTAFKKNGKYYFMPDIRSLYQSIMKKLDSAVEDFECFTEEKLKMLTDATEIVQYNVKSTTFGLEGQWIPSFIGNITIRVEGDSDMLAFVRLLLRFGEYSGVGIKNAIGMGQIGYKVKNDFAL